MAMVVIFFKETIERMKESTARYVKETAESDSERQEAEPEEV